MTTIAWDGQILAVDRQATVGSAKNTVSKMTLTPQRDFVLAGAGNPAVLRLLVLWFVAGRNPKAWPEAQSGDSWTRLIALDIANRRVFVYERWPAEVEVEDPFDAWGSGCEYATGVMACQRSAVEAVRIASRFDAHTGRGCDFFDCAQPELGIQRAPWGSC